MAHLARMISAPVARATGRCVQTLANHASMYAMVALAAFGIDYFPREHFNADRSPKVDTRHATTRSSTSAASSWPAAQASTFRSTSAHCGLWHVGHRGGRR